MSPPARKQPPIADRVVQKHGAYYFLKPIIKPDGKRGTKWIRLGKEKAEALRNYADIISDGAGFFGAVIEQYRTDELPKKAENTINQQGSQLDRIKRAFGKMRPLDIKPRHIYQYHQAVGKNGGIYQANRELSLIKVLCKFAVNHGHIDVSPATTVSAFQESPRTRYVSHEELEGFKAICRPDIAALINLAYITGQRRCDLLGMTWANEQGQGLYIQQSKTGARLHIKYSDKLKAALKECRELSEGSISSVYVLCRPNGRKLTESAFNNEWKRTMKKWVKAGNERFQFRDIRGKAGSDSKGDQLGHTTKKTLKRHYKRLPELVDPTV